MFGLIVGNDHIEELREVLAQENIVFTKLGPFSGDAFLQTCQAASKVQIQTLVVDINCTDESSLIKGIRVYRLARNTRIILLAPGRIPGDPTINSLVGLQVWDIVAPRLESEGEGEEVDDSEELESIGYYLQQQLQVPVSYGNAARWDIKLDQNIERNELQQKKKKENKEKNLHKDRKRDDDPFLDESEYDLPSVVAREKLLLQETIVGSILITIIGVENTVGATHTSLLVTNYLVRKGYNVAIIEASDKHDFEALELAYEGRKERSPTLHFQMEGAKYFKNGYDVDLSLFKDYDYIVLDLGYYGDSPYMDEFKRAHVQIVVGHGSEWRQGKLYEFSQLYEPMDQSQWFFCIPFAEDIVLQDISRALDSKNVYAIPAHPDPFKPGKATDTILDTLLNDVLGQRRVTSHTGVLYGVIAVAVLIIFCLIYLLIQK